MRITYETLSRIINRMTKDQRQSDVTVEIPGASGSECFFAELRISDGDGSLDEDHPVIYVNFDEDADVREDDPDKICYEIGIMHDFEAIMVEFREDYLDGVHYRGNVGFVSRKEYEDFLEEWKGKAVELFRYQDIDKTDNHRVKELIRKYLTPSIK